MDKANQYGLRTWGLVRKYAGDKSVLPQLYTLLHHLDDHTINILNICNHSQPNAFPPSPLYIRLNQFYSQPQLHFKLRTKRYGLTLYEQLYSPAQYKIPPANRYAILENTTSSLNMDTTNYHSEVDATVSPGRTPPKNPPNNLPETLWVNDTSVNRLSEIILNQLEIDRQKKAEAGDIDIEP